MHPTFVSRGFGERLGVSYVCDIEAVIFDQHGLRIYVARGRNEQDIVSGLVVEFADANRFRCLDEVDISSYTGTPGFVFGYNVVEVFQGGWSAECDDLIGINYGRREWLVVTGNLCVSVLSEEEPRIRHERWHFDKGPNIQPGRL